MEDADRAKAHYIWPPRWLDDEPAGLSPPTQVNPAELGEVVFEFEFTKEIRMRAFRDGMLAYDFGTWGDPPPERLNEWDAEIRYQIRCVRLMNAYLACLHAECMGGMEARVVAPSHLISVLSATGEYRGGGGEPLWSEFAFAREEPVLRANDWRCRRGAAPIPVQFMEQAAQTLKQLLDRPKQERALLRAELLFRSVAAFEQFDFAAALVNAWTATEALLGDEMKAYLRELNDERSDKEECFANRERRDFLQGVSSRIANEILSFADRIPLPLYHGIRKSARARNNWLHNSDEKESLKKKAETAIVTAEQLFEQVEGVAIPMAPSTRLHLV